jgi:ABC-type bacteriocin/lantibiotic exporter with double-glycine peptidase domain
MLTLCYRYTELKRAAGGILFPAPFVFYFPRYLCSNICAAGALQRIHDVMERVPAPAAGLPSSSSSSAAAAAAAAAAQPVKPAIKGDIRFSNVTFSYASRAQTPVLRGFDLHIPAGVTCDV